MNCGADCKDGRDCCCAVRRISDSRRDAVGPSCAACCVQCVGAMVVSAVDECELLSSSGVASTCHRHPASCESVTRYAAAIARLPSLLGENWRRYHRVLTTNRKMARTRHNERLEPSKTTGIGTNSYRVEHTPSAVRAYPFETHKSVN